MAKQKKDSGLGDTILKIGKALIVLVLVIWFITTSFFLTKNIILFIILCGLVVFLCFCIVIDDMYWNKKHWLNFFTYFIIPLIFILVCYIAYIIFYGGVTAYLVTKYVLGLTFVLTTLYFVRHRISQACKELMVEKLKWLDVLYGSIPTIIFIIAMGIYQYFVISPFLTSLMMVATLLIIGYHLAFMKRLS